MTAVAGDPFCQANVGHSFTANEIYNEFYNYDTTAQAEVEIERYRTEIEQRYALAPIDLVDHMTPFYRQIVVMTEAARAAEYDYVAWEATGFVDVDGYEDSEAFYSDYVHMKCDQ